MRTQPSIAPDGCSTSARRATEALAIVLIADDVEGAVSALNDFTTTRPAAIVIAEAVDGWSVAESDQ